MDSCAPSTPFWRVVVEPPVPLDGGYSVILVGGYASGTPLQRVVKEEPLLAGDRDHGGALTTDNRDGQ